MSNNPNTTNYADEAGLTGGWSIDDEESGARPPPSEGDLTIASMGKPVHTSCCPTGTLEFVPGDAAEEDCCGAVEATVAAMTRRLSLHPPKILILTGSLRKESCSRLLAVEVGRILASYGAAVRLYDPTGLPIFNSDDDPDDIPKAKELRELTMWSEGMVWISPEVHGNYSAAFKNQVDWMPLSVGAIRPTQGKTCAVMQVEAGSQTFNTVNNLRVLGRWMRMVVIPNQASIPRAYTEFDEQSGELKPSSIKNRVVDVVDELFKYTLLLRDQQPYLLQRYSEKVSASEKNLRDTTSMADPATLQGLSSPLVIDVRSIKEVNMNKGGIAIEDSFHVPLNVDGQPQSVHRTTASEFKRKLREVDALPTDKTTPIITHCTSGKSDYVGRGARAAALLRDLGYVNSHNGGSADEIRDALGR